MPSIGSRNRNRERLSAKRSDLRARHISGYTDNVIAHRGVLDEGVLFMQKPFEPNALAAKVRQAIQGPPPTRQGGSGEGE